MPAPYERIMVLDFETLWDIKDYTLSKLTTEEYIRDPRFHAYGLAYRWLGEKQENTYWVDHADIPEFVKRIDWPTTAVVAHNAQFDVAILAWVYGAMPGFIFDSLSMARALRGVEVGNSLAKLARELGLPPKGDDVKLTDGLGKVLPPDVYEKIVRYCKHDVNLCEAVFAHSWMNAYEVGRQFPMKELRLIDMTLRMFLEPKLVLDGGMLSKALVDEKAKREALLAKLEVDEKKLSSNEEFADLLWKLGIETPRKPSPSNAQKLIPAFAKTDAAFQALLNHDNEDISLLCEARLKVKSTQERTRAQRFYDIAQRGPLPVPLNYYGAHTGRWSASKGQSINLQNLKRGSFLRKSIMAPEGYECVVADLSQIEPRVLAWLADYKALLEIFEAGGDPYATFGAQMFNIPGLTKESHPDLRQSAKSALLGAGYGLGWRSFAQQLIPGFLGAPPTLYDKAFAKLLGITGSDVQHFIDWEPKVGEPWIKQALAIPRSCSDEAIVIHSVCAQRIIEKYREAAAPVPKFWKFSEEAIGDALAGDGIFDFKCLTFRRGHIFLPNGMALRYPDLTYSKKDGGWLFAQGDKRTKLYGGKLTENIVQAVARIVMTDGMLRIQKRYPVVLTVHDECCVLAPEGEGEEAYAFMLECMTKAPAWAPDLPLKADGGWGSRYGDVK
jgi:DNA polymerase